MAITVGTATSGYAAQFATTLSFSASQDTGDNRCMVVQVSLIEGSGSIAITYGGESMTRAIQRVMVSGNRQTEIWYLVDPPTGSNTVEITLTGSFVRMIANAQALTGVDQANPIGTTNSVQISSTTNWAISLTTAYDNSLIIQAGCEQNLFTVTPASSQTTNYNVAQDNRGWGAYKATTTAGSIAMNYTLSSPVGGTMVVAEIRESTGGPTPTASHGMFAWF